MWVWTYYDGVFLCTLNFYLAAQGGGGFKPPKPPPRRSATVHISNKIGYGVWNLFKFISFFFIFFIIIIIIISIIIIINFFFFFFFFFFWGGGGGDSCTLLLPARPNFVFFYTSLGVGLYAVKVRRHTP